MMLIASIRQKRPKRRCGDRAARGGFVAKYMGDLVGGDLIGSDASQEQAIR
jgi:hypothetical protein